jgi:hypothetical protein
LHTVAKFPLGVEFRFSLNTGLLGQGNKFVVMLFGTLPYLFCDMADRTAINLQLMCDPPLAFVFCKMPEYADDFFGGKAGVAENRSATLGEGVPALPAVKQSDAAGSILGTRTDVAPAQNSVLGTFFVLAAKILQYLIHLRTRSSFFSLARGHFVNYNPPPVSVKTPHFRH